MALSKEQLVFFPSDQADSDNVGAYLTDASGNLLTSTLLSGHQALDVNVVSSITTTPPSDVTPATQNITAQDVGSTSTSGANGQSIITGSPTAGSTASFALSSEAAVRVQVTGTWTGTLQSELSNDGGTTWYPTNLAQNSNPVTGPSWTANLEAVGNVAGATNFRIRATAAWTGTATVKVVESLNSGMVNIGNPLRLVDGSSGNLAVIKGPSTAAAAGDDSLVVGLSPNSPLPSGSNTIGSVNQAGAPWSQNLTEVGGSAVSLGQKASAASIPVVIASDQSSIPVSATQSGTWTTRIEDSSGNALNSTSGSLNVDVTNTVPVSQSGTWTVQQGTPPWSVVGNVADGSADSGDPVKVGSRALVGNTSLTAVGADGDRADLISDAYRRLYTNESADIAAQNRSISVTSTAAALPTPLAGRKSFILQNNGSKTIYVGSTSGVTSSTGLAIPASASLELDLGPDVTLYVVTATSTSAAILFEIA